MDDSQINVLENKLNFELTPVDNIAWFPNVPPAVIPEGKNTSLPTETCDSNEIVETKQSNIWDETSLRYTSVNWWSPKIPKSKKEGCRKFKIPGVEVRELPPNHFLGGQKGLFATCKFSIFDIIGEYTGRIVDDDVNDKYFDYILGHYVAALEDKAHHDSLGIDAENCGNEMRFINSYLNIEFSANVTMRTVYINTFPHLVIVCMREILPGEEILLDYGAAYTNAYLTPKDPVTTFPNDFIRDELPFMSDIE